MDDFVLSTYFKDTDWEPLYAIFIKCFSDEPKLACFHPHGLDPSHLTANIQLFKSRTFSGPTERAAACIRDSNNDSIVAFVSCRVYRDQRGVLAQPPPESQICLPQVEDPREREYWEWFRTELGSRVRDIEALHHPVVVIQALAVDPRWRRRGASRMLLEWVSEFAAKAGGLRVAVHPGALALKIGFYERSGFRIGQEMTLKDKEKFPERKGIYMPMMIKDCSGNS